MCISETTDLVFPHNHLSNLQRIHPVSVSSLGHKSFPLGEKDSLMMSSQENGQTALTARYEKLK